MTDAKAPASLAEALAALQGRLPHVAKDAENPHFRSKYANLESITDALMPVLSELGLSFSALPTMNDPLGFVLAYELEHVSGESKAGFYPLPASGSPQQIGSAITYARRYALCAVTGLAPGGDDDDGNAAEQAKAGDPARDERGWIKPADRNSAVTPGPERLPRAGTNAELREQGRMDRKQKSDHEKLAASTVKRARGEPRPERGGKLENDPWETRPMEERENEPGTVNDLQLRAIWMLLKNNAGVTDNAAGHAMARAALGLADDALLSEPDQETGEVRETLKRLSHAQAAEFIRQLQDGSPA